MDLNRVYAKKAVKLVKRQQRGIGKKAEEVDMCTDIAIRIQEGNIPEWLLRALDKESLSDASSVSGESSFQENEGLSDDETNLPTHVTSRSVSREPRKLISRYSTEKRSQSTHLSARSRESLPLSHWEPRIPSGFITTRYPPFDWEFTPVSPLLQKQKVDTQQWKHERKPKKKAKRKEQDSTMNKPEFSTTEYWHIPFNPLRKELTSEYNIRDVWEVDSKEDNEDFNEDDVFSDVDYWETQRILRFVRIGNPTATVLALCALKELDLGKPSCKAIICRLDGITLLLNILNTQDIRCRIAALKVILCIGNSEKVSEVILKKNGVQQIVSILDEKNTAIVCAACDVLWLLARNDEIRFIANKLNCIEKLMKNFSNSERETLKGENLDLCRSICYALWSCCQDIKRKHIMLVSESLPVISTLLDSRNETLTTPLLGIVEQCSSVQEFRVQMENQNFVENVIWKILPAAEDTVQFLCIKIIFKCAVEPSCQKLKNKNLKVIMDLLKNISQTNNDQLLVLLLGIVWRCSLERRQRKRFNNFSVLPFLVDILKSNNTLQVKSTTLGALSEFFQDESCSDIVVELGIVDLLIGCLSFTKPLILVNTARCLSACACNSSLRSIILGQDGLRLLWSLLKSNNDKVVISGAVSIACLCECPQESAYIVRSIVGGVVLLMSVLTNTDLTKEKVLISLCEAVVKISQDSENRSILTDYGLIPVIIRLCQTENKILRYYVTCLIARCCETNENIRIFSSCVPFLVEGLGNEHVEHVYASVNALYELSRDSTVCVLLQDHSSSKILLELLGSRDERVQNAAAGCLGNVRKSLTAKLDRVPERLKNST